MITVHGPYSIFPAIFNQNIETPMSAYLAARLARDRVELDCNTFGELATKFCAGTNGTWHADSFDAVIYRIDQSGGRDNAAAFLWRNDTLTAIASNDEPLQPGDIVSFEMRMC